MTVDGLPTFSITTNHDLLEACLSLADASSLVELERRLDTWLAQLYAPKAWRVVWPTHMSDEPIIEMQSCTDEAYVPRADDHVVQMLLQAGAQERGMMELCFSALQPVADHITAGLEQLARVLANRLSRVHMELKSLAQSAELFFVRSLLHGSAPAGVNRNLDELANTLLVHLNVSSFQVLIDRGGPGGLSWGVSSRRVSLAVSVEDRQRLLQLAEAAFHDKTDCADNYWLLRREQLHVLEQQYDLPYLAHLQSMLIIPIQRGSTFLGAVIAGEQRQWERQPISRQAITICTLIAQSVAEAVTQSRLVTQVIERVRSMQALIDGLGDAVISTRHGAIISWNRAAQHLFGYQAEEVLGRSIYDVLPSAPAELGDREFLAKHPKAAGPAIEWMMQTTDGPGLHLTCAITHLYNDDSDEPTLMYVLKEIGKEQELEYLKDELLSGVSHELRTPLNGIYGFSRLLIDRPHLPDEMRREALESLQWSVERLTRLTDDFIDVARARRQRLPIELDQVELEQVVRATIREQQRRHREHTIVLRVQKNLPCIRGDSMRIKQVLDNLVSNAAKYSPEGTAIRVYVRRHNGMVAVSVFDRGVGIPRDVQERVFEPFYRAHNSRSQRANGVGLGLSIVKSLVHAHNGQIKVKSTPGRGSVFTFTLPIMNEHLPAQRNDATTWPSDEK